MNTVVDVLDRQRRRGLQLARRRHHAVQAGEKNDNWEGGFRDPDAMAQVARRDRSPAPGQQRDHLALQDWLPTFMAAVGEPNIVEKLKKGHQRRQ